MGSCQGVQCAQREGELKPGSGTDSLASPSPLSPKTRNWVFNNFQKKMKTAGCAQSYALAFAALVIFLGSAEGNSNELKAGTDTSLSCYQCNSEYDPRCGDPFDPYSLGTVNCSLIEPLEHLDGKKAMICRKNVQKVYGKVRVVRGCGYLDDDYLNAKKCLYRSGTYNVYATYCSCTGNLCNSSNRLTIPIAFLGLVSLAAFL